MKKYKVVQVKTSSTFEAELNDLAKEGWRVVSASMAYSGLKNEEPEFFALLENQTVEEEIKSLLEENTATDLSNINLSPSAN